MIRSRELARPLHRLAVGYLWRLQHFTGAPLPPDLDSGLVETIKRVRRYTLTTPRRVAALCDGVRYVVRNEVPGEIAECGVWRGGSMMAVALTLLEMDVRDRDLYLYDTFQGMSKPTEADVRSAYDGYSLHRRWRRRRSGQGSTWAAVPAEQVLAAMTTTGYPPKRVHLVKGKVEDTLPRQAPERLSLLRLDTDWYASTRHSLEHLYPRLSVGGVLIVDDYGHYEGARRAVDEYLDDVGARLLLNRIDYTARVAVKQEDS